LPFQIKNYEYPHQCKKGEIAKVVLQPGDPLRAKYIAENFLEDAKLVSQTRGILYYTGLYKGKEISVGASGMGFPSIGIYSFELFTEYDVDTIIRIGTCGAYTTDLKVYDLLNVENAAVKAPMQNSHGELKRKAFLIREISSIPSTKRQKKCL
jgi:DeoD family purine-nucleoside phosphorylase